MEENIQRVFAILISIIIFFIIPIYISFEKKDDISYSLALKITTEFVNNVKNNGYISEDMYKNFVYNLSVTDNIYEISLEHKSYKYNPIIVAYEDKEFTKPIKNFDYELYKTEYINKNSINYQNNIYKFLKVEYSVSEEVYTDKHILETINRGNSNLNYKMKDEEDKDIDIKDIDIEPNIFDVSDNSAIYTLNEGDEFNVIIKNTNVTIAEKLFNSFTFSLAGNIIPRVYVNYGAIVSTEAYTENINDEIKDKID